MTPEIPDEIELLKSSMQGDAAAFEVIVKNYQPLICAITFSSTGDVLKSEELAQEVFISAWKDMRQLRDLRKFRSWLCTIARNAVRNSFRKQKRDIISNASSIDQVADPGASESNSAAAEITSQQQAVVAEALKQIPPKYRDPLVLFYRQEQSVKAVAEQLELSEPAVKQRLSRGRKLLKLQVAAIVESTITRSGPGIAFTAAVVASLPALAPQVASAAIAAAVAKGSLAAKSAPLIGTIGWILGPLLGFLGAAIAIRNDLKNASPRERRFIIITVSVQLGYVTLLTSIAIGLCLWWKFHLSRTAWPLLMIYFVLLFLPGIPFVIWCSRREKKIQIEEGTWVGPQWRTLKMTKSQIYGAFGGSIFGSLAWLYRVTIAAGDWTAFWIILVAGILIFLAATRLCSKYPQLGFKIASGVFICISLLNLIAANLRWDIWSPVLKHDRITLSQINFSIIALTAILLSVALSADWRYRKVRKNNDPAD